MYSSSYDSLTSTEKNGSSPPLIQSNTVAQGSSGRWPGNRLSGWEAGELWGARSLRNTAKAGHLPTKPVALGKGVGKRQCDVCGLLRADFTKMLPERDEPRKDGVSCEHK